MADQAVKGAREALQDELAALENEKKGYEVQVEQIKAGGPGRYGEDPAARIKDVNAEIKRVKAALGKAEDEEPAEA